MAAAATPSVGVLTSADAVSVQATTTLTFVESLLTDKVISSTAGTAVDKFDIHADHDRQIISYYSSNQATRENHNGKFKDDSGQTIWCRHLVFAFLVLWQSRKVDSFAYPFLHYRALFSSQMRIGEFSFLSENRVDRYRLFEIASRHYFIPNLSTENNLGKALKTICASLTAGQEKLLHFCSVDHAMVITVQIKPTETSKPERCVVTFYDPNDTVRHRKFIMPKEKLDQLTLADLQLVVSYFGEFATALLIEEDRDLKGLISDDAGAGVDFRRMAPSVTAVKTVVPLGTEAEQSEPKVLSEIIFYLFHYRLDSELLQSYVNKIILNTELSISQKVGFLAAKSADGTPGLFTALQNGYSNIVNAFVTAVLGHGEFTPAQKLELLSAKRADGTPGLYMALQNGHYQAVSAFVTAVLGHADFTPAQKLELLSTKLVCAMPGLYVAERRGYHQAVSVFVTAVLGHSDFTFEQKLELLSAMPKGATNNEQLDLIASQPIILASLLKAKCSSFSSDFLVFLLNHMPTKERIFAQIKTNKEVLHAIIYQEDSVGYKLFRVQRGPRPCDLTRGTLKEVFAALQALSSSSTAASVAAGGAGAGAGAGLGSTVSTTGLMPTGVAAAGGCGAPAGPARGTP